MNTLKNLGVLVSLSLSLVSVVATGCTDAASDPADAVTGIYQVSAFTHNDAACAPGGDSQLGSDTFAIVTKADVFGTGILHVMSCASAADCRAKQAKLDGGELVTIDFSFDVLADDTGGVFASQG